MEQRVVMLVRQNGDPIFLDHIKESTATCKELKFLIERMQRGDYVKWRKHPSIRPYQSFMSELSMINGVLYRGTTTVIIPTQLRMDLLKMVHNKLSHPGEHSLLDLVVSSN